MLLITVELSTAVTVALPVVLESMMNDPLTVLLSTDTFATRLLFNMVKVMLLSMTVALSRLVELSFAFEIVELSTLLESEVELSAVAPVKLLESMLELPIVLVFSTDPPVTLSETSDMLSIVLPLIKELNIRMLALFVALVGAVVRLPLGR